MVSTAHPRLLVKLLELTRVSLPLADYAIVIFPGYFAFAMGKNKPALKAYFLKVLDESKLPIMIYNFP